MGVNDEDRKPTFFAGGGAASPLTAGSGCSASFSAEVRFLPRGTDFGFSLLPASSPSSAVALGFLERGLAGAFFDGGSGLAWSLMREERRGSAAPALDLRTIQRCVRRKDLGVVVWFRERGAGHRGTLFNVKPCHRPHFLSWNSINRH